MTSRKAKVLASLNEYLDYRISGYQHRKEVIKWQLFSSKIIFYGVFVLVLIGVCFSGIQFHSSLGQKRAKALTDKDRSLVSDAAEKDGITKDEITQVVSTEDEVTEISASLKGIKVSSPVLGVILLVISLLFFYLYLRYVYPISRDTVI